MFDAPPTRLDLNFRLLGFPVRVSPWFWGVTVLFGLPLANRLGPAALLLWVGCVFGSILLHELGHAVAYRWYGAWATQIVLHGFGGYARADRRPATAGRRILVALAGPGVQFALFGLLVGSHLATGWATTNEWTELLFDFLTWINLAWPVLNLLPVFPLDGGQVARELFGLARVRQAEAKTYGVGVAVAGGLAVLSLLLMANVLPPEVAARVPRVLRLGQIGVLFFGLLAWQNYQLMRAARRAYAWDDDPFRRRW